MATTDLTAQRDLEGAYQRAIDILGLARAPVFAGLGTDADGIRAVLRLAAQLGASVDHADAATIARDLRVFADAGQMGTTPAEARHRGDLVLVVGKGAAAYASATGLFEDDHPVYPWRDERNILTLGVAAPAGIEASALTASVATISDVGDGILPILAALRARLAGRPCAATVAGHDLASLEARLDLLKAAQFGVALYDPADLDALEIELLQGLVKDLNAGTRFTTLAVPGGFNARIAHIVSAWTTGGPLRVGFGRGYPEQDSWVHDAERLVASGEADALVWIGALGPELPDYAALVPTIALLPEGSDGRATVTIRVGVPGRDHGGTLYEPHRDGFTYMPATAPSDLPSVAGVIGRLTADLSGKGG